MLNHGDRVITRLGTGVLEARDSSGQYWRVVHEDGTVGDFPAGMIKPAPATIEAIDSDGRHWLVSPPALGAEFWSMECLTPPIKAAAEAKTKADK